VALEAAAMGVPILAGRVTGSVDAVVDGVTGILVPARDSAALGQAMSMYARDEKTRKAHGIAGRQRAIAEFRPESLWKAQYEEYIRLLNENCIPSPNLQS